MEFYAYSNRRDKVDILRHIIRAFILLDRNLDEDAFLKFVKEHVVDWAALGLAVVSAVLGTWALIDARDAIKKTEGSVNL